LDIVDVEGFASLNLRNLASRLGVRAPSLYAHFTGKDDILNLVVDAILLREDEQWDPPAPWRKALTYAAHWWYDLFRRYPEVLASIQRRPNVRPLGVRTVECVVDALTGAGLSREAAEAAYVLLFGYVLGIASVRQGRELVALEEQGDQDSEAGQ